MGIDPTDANDWQWTGALRVLELLDDMHVVRTLLENTAKDSKKPRPQPRGLRRYGRRR